MLPVVRVLRHLLHLRAVARRVIHLLNLPSGGGRSWILGLVLLAIGRSESVQNYIKRIVGRFKQEFAANRGEDKQDDSSAVKQFARDRGLA